MNNDISNLFDIFSYVPSTNKTYSVFTGMPNQISQPQGTQQVDTSSAVQAALSRNPLWFSGSVNSDISPTVELSLYWPLNLLVATSTKQSTNTFEINRIGPPKAKHWIVMSMMLQSVDVFENQEQYGLSIGPGDGGGLQLPTTAVLIPDSLMLTVNAPLIGGKLTAFLNAIPYEQQGIKPIYLGNGNNLFANLLTNSTGRSYSISYSYYELPENQPFGNLISCI